MTEGATHISPPRALVISIHGIRREGAGIEQLARAGASVVIVDSAIGAEELVEIQSAIEAAGGISLALLPSPDAGRRIVDFFGRWDVAIGREVDVAGWREMLARLERKHWPRELLIRSEEAAPGTPREERWTDAAGRVYSVRLTYADAARITAILAG